MMRTISHDLQEETPEAKARWFQSLSIAEHMEMLCQLTDLVLESNPMIAERKEGKAATGRVRILSKAQS